MSRLRRFLPPQVADLIVASGSEKQLESHRREITALFCDLRGFTGFTESADAEDVMALLRDYHAAIGEIIIKYSGTLERYAGDGVMVVFNDPVPVENPALQAVLMALELRDAIGKLTDKWRRFGHDNGFGIGIAHGFAIRSQPSDAPSTTASIDHLSFAPGQPLCKDRDALAAMILGGLLTSDPTKAATPGCQSIPDDAKLERLERYPSVFPSIRMTRVKVTSPSQPDLTSGFILELGR
jgi:hypothetical protein